MLIIVEMLVSFYLISMTPILPVNLILHFSFHFLFIYYPFLVKKGDRIAQLICEKIEMADLVEEQVFLSFIK